MVSGPQIGTPGAAPFLERGIAAASRPGAPAPPSREAQPPRVGQPYGPGFPPPITRPPSRGRRRTVGKRVIDGGQRFVGGRFDGNAQRGKELAADFLASAAAGEVRGQRVLGVGFDRLAVVNGCLGLALAGVPGRMRFAHHNCDSWTADQLVVDNPAAWYRHAATFSAGPVVRKRWRQEKGKDLCLERWLSGRKRRFAKPVTGVNPVHGFESRPLRFS